VAKAVRAIKAYDADESTITLAAAGLTPYHDPKTGKPNEFASVPVNKYFYSRRIQGHPMSAEQAQYSMNTMRDIYFSGLGEPFSAQLILHETLHMFTGGNDEALAKRLGVTIKDGNTGPITDALKEGGCGD
jgi:hypothetical protein